MRYSSAEIKDLIQNIDKYDFIEFIANILPEEFSDKVYETSTYNDNLPLLFRGMRTNLGDYLITTSPKQIKMDKYGMQTGLVLFTDYFLKKFGFTATPTNSIFCSNSFDMSYRYTYDVNDSKVQVPTSSVYLVLPFGGCSYTHSVVMDDYIESYSILTLGDEYYPDWENMKKLNLPKWFIADIEYLYKEKHINDYLNLVKDTHSGLDIIANFTLFILWYCLIKYYNEVPRGPFHERWKYPSMVFSDLKENLREIFMNNLGYRNTAPEEEDMEKEIQINGKMLMIDLDWIMDQYYAEAEKDSLSEAAKFLKR